MSSMYTNLSHGKYSNDVLEKLEKTRADAQSFFLRSSQQSKLRFASPDGLFRILVDWALNPKLIETALWSAALLSSPQHEYSKYLAPNYSALAYKLTSLVSLLSEKQSRRLHYVDLENILLNNYLPNEVIALLSAMILVHLEEVEIIDQTDAYTIGKQAESISKNIVSKRLGSWKIRRQLLDAANHCMYPDDYYSAQEDLNNTLMQTRIHNLIEETKRKVYNAASKRNIENFEIITEIAHPYRIINLKRQRRYHVLDPRSLVTFIIISPDEDTCYDFLPVLSNIGNPLRSFRDHIQHQSSKSFEGYKAIHVSIKIQGGEPLRFFIRTREWQNNNEYGVLSKFQTGLPSEDDVYKVDTLDTPEDHIFVLTVNGDAHILPKESCVRDLIRALNIENIQKDRFNESRLFREGKQLIVTHETKLIDGDIVDFSPSALFPSNSVLPKETRLRNKSTRLSISENSGSKDVNYPLASASRLYQSSIVLPEQYTNLKSYPIYLCQECKPFPDNQHEKMIGYVTDKKTITIHRANCHRIVNTAKAISIHWIPRAQQPGGSIIEIEAWNRVGLLENVVHEISKNNLNISNLVADTYTNNTATIKLYLDEGNPKSLRKIEQSITNIDYVDSVKIGIVHHAASDDIKINLYSPKPALNDGLFFGRAKERQQIWETIDCQTQLRSVLLQGQQRIGKTSLLKRIEADANVPTNKYIAIYLTLEAYEGTEFKKWFVKSLLQKSKNLLPQSGALIGDLAATLDAEPKSALIQFINAFNEEIAPNHKIVVLIDEFQQLLSFPDTYIYNSVSFLSDFLNLFQNIAFVFSMADTIYSADKMFFLAPLLALTIKVSLGELEEEAARDLIQKPIAPFPYDAHTLEKLLYVTRCHPYYINLLCFDIFERLKNTKKNTTPISLDLLNSSLNVLFHDASRFSHFMNIVTHSKEILSTMALLTSRPNQFVDFNKLANKLSFGMSAQELAEELNWLCELRVIESPRNSHKYRIRLPVLYHYLVSNKPILTKGS